MKITPADLDRMRQTASHLVEQHHLPGIALGVVSGDEMIFCEGFGYADIEARTPTDPSMRHRIASVTKTVVGLCAMALVDEGRLRLDDRVVDHLPDLRFEGPAERLTVWHLMTHTGGIGEAPTHEALRKFGIDPTFDAGSEVRVPEGYPEGIVLEVAPGTLWAYANHAFVLLGEIIARAERQPIHALLQRRVFDPLGMTDSDCLDQHHPRLSTPYHRAMPEHTRELVLRAGGKPREEEPAVDGHNIRGKFTPMHLPAAGAVQSTIPDMCKYAAALLRNGRGIVRPETFTSMTSPQYCPHDKFYNMGLTFFRKRRWGYETIGHGGSMFGGWNTQLIALPDEDVAFVAHANIQWDDTYAIMYRILQALLDGKDSPALVAPIAPSILESAPGVYEATGGPMTNFRISTTRGRIQVTRTGDELFLRARRGPWKRGARMLPASPGDPGYFLLDIESIVPTYVAFDLDSRGRVTALRFDECALLRKNPALQPWA
jgi:CubicO group peptidase (beta-lactamase class C family)